MCGLVGVAGNLSVTGERAFKRLLELDTIRGPHSTGIFAVKSDRSTMLAKQVGTPWDLYETKASEKIFQAVTKVLLGHNRWATKGKINKLNAHPFEFDNIAGAHNGTLTTTYQLDDHEMFEVDSENIYYHMNKNGVDDTIRNLNGAFALTWYDKRANTINFIRNSERPLYYVLSDDMKILLWASEDWMLVVAAHSVGLKIKEVQQLPVGHLHTFEVPAIYSDTFDKVRVRKMEMFEKKPVVIYGRGESTTNTFPKDKSEEKKVVDLRPAQTGKIKRPFSEYQKFVGKKTLFYVSSNSVSSTGQHYIQCWAVDDDDISIRVFPQVDGHLWNKLMASTNYFQGVTKAYSGIENGYLTVDLRTIDEVLIGGDDTPADSYKGFEGEEITELEFDKRTSKGCSWCSSHVLVKDHADITWIAKNEFICPDCSDHPEVKQYLTLN